VRGVGDELFDPFTIHMRDDATGSELVVRPANLIRFGGHTFHVSWAPDGGAFVAQGRDSHYVGPGLDSQGLYSIDADTGEVAPLVRSTSITPPDYLEWPVWAVDGRVIFTRWVRGPQVIVSKAPGTSTERELYRVSVGGISHLSSSGDGTLLAFVWSNGDESAVRVLGGGQLDAVELLHVRAPQSVSALAWSPDSRKILVAVDGGDEGGAELLWLPLSGGASTPAGLSLVWRSFFGIGIHPSGFRIAFTAGTPRHREIWVIKQFGSR
jgi:Tol biopolymer transport system component